MSALSAKKRRAAATSQAELSPGDIAQRAYQRWLARGCPQSDGREDWFAAEAELRAETPAPPAPRQPIRSALRRLGI